LWNKYHQWLSDIKLNQISAFCSFFLHDQPLFHFCKANWILKLSRKLWTQQEIDHIHIYSICSLHLDVRKPLIMPISQKCDPLQVYCQIQYYLLITSNHGWNAKLSNAFSGSRPTGWLDFQCPDHDSLKGGMKTWTVEHYELQGLLLTFRVSLLFFLSSQQL
jgi:hypothetical protein